MSKVLPAFAACSGGLGVIVLSVTTHSAFAQQQQQQGALTTASILSDVEWNDNYNLSTDSPGDALIWDTVLLLGLERRTLVDTLVASLEGTFRVSDVPITGTDYTTDNPTAVLLYDRVVGDDALTFGARYQRADVAFFDPLSDIDPFGNFDDTFGDGTRESARANVGIDLNQQGPVSFAFDAATFQVNYFDTNDPSLNDRTINTSAANFGFQLTPTLQMLVGGVYNFSTFDNATDTERTTTAADVGFAAQLNPRLDSTLRIGYSEVVADRTTGRDTQEGVVGSFNLTALQQNGQISAGFAATLNENGERYNATVGKVINWQNSSLSANIGATASADTQARPIGDITYVYNLPRTTVSFGLRQFSSVDDDGNDTLNSYVNAAVRHAITPVSAVSLILSGGLQRFEDTNRQDSERANFTAIYTRALTQDWDMNFGYRGRYRNQENSGEATSNAVFIGVQRDFVSIR